MRLFIFDTETTGLVLHPEAKDEVQPRIIEFAGSVFDVTQRKITGTVYSLLNPGFPISDEIVKITGIQPAWLEASPTFLELATGPLIEFKALKSDVGWDPELEAEFAAKPFPFFVPKKACEGGSKVTSLAKIIGSCDVIIAHNLPFDFDVFRMELKRNKITRVCPPSIGICTVQEYSAQFGKYPKLFELYEFLTGKKLVQTHRAFDDVEALSEIVDVMMDINYINAIRRSLADLGRN
jgi:DNA polymerase III epsilon subunit-like protein